MAYRAKNPATKLIDVRTKLGISRKKLGELTQLSDRTIERYEQKRTDIQDAPVRTVLKIARALNCRIEDIIDESE